jgi:hypothetical protein
MDISYPGTCIANVEMIATLFGGKLGAWLAGDPVPEGADLALELARAVANLNPIGDTLNKNMVRGNEGT